MAEEIVQDIIEEIYNCIKAKGVLGDDFYFHLNHMRDHNLVTVEEEDLLEEPFAAYRKMREELKRDRGESQ